MTTATKLGRKVPRRAGTAMRLALSASVFCGAMLLAGMSAAGAATLREAWEACTARQIRAADRLANCSAIIESDAVKPSIRAQALSARGFAHLAERNLDRALADFDAAIKENP